MKSAEYRDIIRIIAKGAMRKRFPGVNVKALEEAAITIAKNVHARMYGANVDGVGSPLWRDEENKQPDIPAAQLLQETI